MACKIGAGDSVQLALPGRISHQIAGTGTGAENVCVRLVEIAPETENCERRNPHYHPDVEECIYVLEGEGCTHADTGDYQMSAGDTLIMPPNEKHMTRNIGNHTLKLLCFFPTGRVTILGE